MTNSDTSDHGDISELMISNIVNFNILAKLEKQAKIFQDNDIRVLCELKICYGPELPF